MYNSLLADVEYVSSNITNSSTTYTFHDANANKNITVIWGNNTNVNVSVNSANAKVYDMYGNEGNIYKAERSETPRIAKIISELTLSEDPLWKSVSAMK